MTQITQADRDRAAKFRRGVGGKYARDVEEMAHEFAAHRIEAEQQTQWQPIETAPKDGTPFVAGRFTGEGKNHDGRQQVDRWHSRSRGDSYDGLGKFNTQFWPATHWQPLPPAPTTIEEQGAPA